GVLDELLELGHREAVEAREHDRVAVEVARREVDVRLVGEQRLLLALVGDAERDGRLGGRGVAELVEVLGTQGSLPDEQRAVHGPPPRTLEVRVRQHRRDPLDVLPRGHDPTVGPAVPGDQGESARSPGAGQYGATFAAGGKISSSSARSSAVGTHAPAAAFSRTCSGFVAPAITLDTCGRDSSHPNATCTSLIRRTSPNAPRRASAAHGADVRPCGCVGTKRPSSGRAPCAYLPVSRPFASGKYGSTPIPYAAAAGSTSSSAARSTRLYWFCADTNRTVPAARAVSSASAICHPARLECPT